MPPLLVYDMLNILWPVLGYDTGKQWKGCLLDELETAVQGCTQARQAACRPPCGLRVGGREWGRGSGEGSGASGYAWL